MLSGGAGAQGQVAHTRNDGANVTLALSLTLSQQVGEGDKTRLPWPLTGALGPGQEERSDAGTD